MKREFRSLLTGDRKKSCPHLVELMTEEHASAMKSAFLCLGLVSIASVASGGIDAMDVMDSAEVLRKFRMACISMLVMGNGGLILRVRTNLFLKILLGW